VVGGVLVPRICGLFTQPREDQDAFATGNHMKDRASPVARAFAVLTLLKDEDSPSVILGFQVIENKGLKKSLLKMKFWLDKILFCDRISLVEKCAPI